MICLKIALFLMFLIICKVHAEKDDIQDNEAAVQRSIAKRSNENEILQSPAEQKNLDNQVDKMHISSDVEVFEENSGSHKAKQEEEEKAADEEETPPDATKPNNENTETATEPDPTANEENEVPPQTEGEAEVETATEAVNKEEAVAEAGNEEGTAAEEETTQPNDVANTDGEAAGNDEAEMPNDEPAKEEENETPDLKKVSSATDADQKEVSCFFCTSNEDDKCAIATTKEIKCPKTSEGDAGKHNGCYTLYQADTNITMRGCVDDLAEGGLKYCLTNEKLCNLCYSNACNDKLAPSKAATLQSNIYTLLVLNISSLVAIICASLKFYKF